MELRKRTREQVIEEAASAYGNFLDALGFDWRYDDHMRDTPRRVAKAWYDDLARGHFEEAPNITAFPNDEGYTGLILDCNIPVISMCSHHNLPFIGVAHVGYIPGKDREEHKVIGLSKLNRIVDHYSRRPNVQETLTKQIHDYINEVCVGNRGVGVVIEAHHQCVSCRGIKHNSIMKTSQLSGYFHTNEVGTRVEFFSLINKQ